MQPNHPQTELAKKAYHRPQLTIYGTVQQLTQNTTTTSTRNQDSATVGLRKYS